MSAGRIRLLVSDVSDMKNTGDDVLLLVAEVIQ